MDEFEQNLREEEQHVTIMQESDSPVKAAAKEVRNIIASPKFLTMIVLLAVSVPLTVFGSITYFRNYIIYLVSTLEGIVNPREIDSFYDALNASGITSTAALWGVGIAALCECIPRIVTTIGYAVAYSSAGKPTEKMKTSGLTVLKVMNIISIVGYALLAVVEVTIIPIVLVIMSSDAYQSTFTREEQIVFSVTKSILIVVAVILAVVYIGIALLYIFRGVGFNRAIESTKSVLNGEVPNKKITGFAPVFHIVASSFALFGSLSLLMFGGWMLSLVNISLGIAGIFLGTTILKIKDVVKGVNVK